MFRAYYHDVHLLVLTLDHIQQLIWKLFLMHVVHMCYVHDLANLYP